MALWLKIIFIGYRDKYDSIEKIISFDLEKEDFGTVIPPKDTFDDGGLWSLAELMGMLWLFGSPEDISTMDIWVLKDSKNYMWAKEYTIDLAGFNFGVRFISILDHKEGKILMDVDSEILEWYDVDNKCFERVDNLRSVPWSWSVLNTDGLFSLGNQYPGA